jgi:hypothetical protein
MQRNGGLTINAGRGCKVCKSLFPSDEWTRCEYCLQVVCIHCQNAHSFACGVNEKPKKWDPTNFNCMQRPVSCQSTYCSNKSTPAALVGVREVAGKHRCTRCREVIANIHV